MLVQANLADSGLTGSEDVCFGGRNLLQRKGNNTKRQSGGYFIDCYSQSQNNHLLLHLCIEIIPFNKVSEGHSYKKPSIMEGSNMSHSSFIHDGEKELNLPQRSQHKRVQTLISSQFLQFCSHLPSARRTLYTPQPLENLWYWNQSGAAQSVAQE